MSFRLPSIVRKTLCTHFTNSLKNPLINLSKTTKTTSWLTSRKFATEATTSKPIILKLPEESFKAYKCDPPSLDVEITKDEAIDMYKSMVLMRRMETAADSLYKAKMIRGFCHLCTGQVRKFFCGEIIKRKQR